MIRGTLNTTWQKIDPQKYELTDDERSTADTIQKLTHELNDKVAQLRKSIVEHQDKCTHKVFMEHEEEGRDSWFGKEVKEYWRCAVCDAEFIGHHYTIPTKW